MHCYSTSISAAEHHRVGGKTMTRSTASDGAGQEDQFVREHHTGFSGVGEHDNSLALYVVSLYNVSSADGELINGDALVVRPRGTPQIQLVASVLGCEPRDIVHLVRMAGTFSVREVSEIDGHRIRFDVA